MEKIQDYAIIGNGRAAALVSTAGSIDWFCLPRFDSPSIFGAILDDQMGGFWKISPFAKAHVERSYIDETNVLQTRFTTEKGTLLLTDFMAAFSEEEKQTTLQPEHELIREIKCESGEMEISIHYYPRPCYGQLTAKLKDLKKLGIRFEVKQHLFTLICSIPLQVKEGQASATVTLQKDEKITFSLTYTVEGPAILPPLEECSNKRESTIAWWQKWASECRFKGPFRKEVIRSALTLKLLSFAPSGAFIAAPTTSLPEKLQGSLNWDYRYCWVRDASFTVQALFALGYRDDAKAFVSWLLHSTRLTLPKLKVLYDVYGRDPIKEVTLSHLKGYFNSIPVRLGNAATNQFQLDCYGEVVDAVSVFIKEGGEVDSEVKKMLRLFGNYICKHWHEEDNGIWEYREQKYHYTYSKLMCWVVLDRLIEMHLPLSIEIKVVRTFIETRELIRKEIETNGWNGTLESYVETLHGTRLDMTLLLLSFHGFEKANTQRMQQSYAKIKERLYLNNALFYRGERGKSEQEGAFVMCCFWVSEFLAKDGGTLEEAKEVFTKLLHLANDVGLFSEEIDPTTHGALGNFPQAFTHIALINAALAIEEREKKNELG